MVTISEISQFPTKQELVVRMLRRAILDGTYKPGQRLRQDEVAAAVNLSRTPIREAFRQLEVEGLITIDANHRVIVADLSMQELEELYFVRMLVEPTASRLGAEHVSDETLAQMREILDRMETLVRPEDRLAFIQLDEEFHALHYRSSGHRRLCELVLSLRASSERYIRAFYAVWPHRQEDSVSLERQLLEACERHDGEQAERLMRSMLSRTVETIRGFLKD